VNKILGPSRYRIRLSVSQYSQQKARALQDLMKRGTCSPRVALSIPEISKMFPRGSLAGLLYTDPADGWNRVAQTVVDAELTSKVIEIHHSLKKKDGDFESSICPGERWMYRVVNGTGTLSFSKSIDWDSLDPMNDSKKQDPKRATLKLAMTHVEQL